MSGALAAIRVRSTGVRIAVRLTPRGGRDAIEGWLKDSEGNYYLKARVALAPESGKANKSLTALLAGGLSVSKSSIRVAAGETSRRKTIDIDGNVAALTAQLKAFGEIE